MKHSLIDQHTDSTQVSDLRSSRSCSSRSYLRRYASSSSRPSGLVSLSTFILSLPPLILPPTFLICCSKTCWMQPAKQ